MPRNSLGVVALLALVFGTDMDRQLIFRASSLLLFYIGGAAAVYRWNVLALDRYAKQCLALLAVMCVAIIGFRIDDNTVLVMAAPFLIWPAASLDAVTRVVCASRALLRMAFAALLPTMVSVCSTSAEVNRNCAPTSVETVNSDSWAARAPA